LLASQEIDTETRTPHSDEAAQANFVHSRTEQRLCWSAIERNGSGILWLNYVIGITYGLA
jgi:hypothetical protein